MGQGGVKPVNKITIISLDNVSDSDSAFLSTILNYIISDSVFYYHISNVVDRVFEL
jgi:hypothetical protein